MFNGLIALEEAAAGNSAAAAAAALWCCWVGGGGVGGCRISLGDALGNRRKWQNYPNGRSGGVVSDVGYFVFSSQHCSSSVFCAGSPPLPLTPLPPPPPLHGYHNIISLLASGRQLQLEPYHWLPAWKIS